MFGKRSLVNNRARPLINNLSLFAKYYATYVYIAIILAWEETTGA